MARRTVERIMRHNGWRGVMRARRPPRTTESDPAAAQTPTWISRSVRAAVLLGVSLGCPALTNCGLCVHFFGRHGRIRRTDWVRLNPVDSALSAQHDRVRRRLQIQTDVSRQPGRRLLRAGGGVGAAPRGARTRMAQHACAAVGLELMRRGHEVVMAALLDQVGFVAETGLAAVAGLTIGLNIRGSTSCYGLAHECAA